MSLHAASAPSNRPDPSGRDRLLAFAFAAADLLLEVAEGGVITFAAGASRGRLGLTPQELLGRPISCLFVASEHAALSLALSTAALRGRSQPVVLRLSDPETTPMILSGLAMPSAPGRLFFALARLPDLPGAAPAPAATFTQAAEAILSSGAAGTLDLFELSAWDRTKRLLPPAEQEALTAEIMDVLRRGSGPASVSGELAAGRFGVVGPGTADLMPEIETVLSARPATARTKLHHVQVPLAGQGLTGIQAARALRVALSRFTGGGVQATKAAGFEGGLASFITRAQHEAQTVRSAIADSRFRLAFQPIVHLSNGSVHHYEALLRPTGLDGTMVATTQDFISFTEAFGLTEELDWAVLRQAIQAQQGANAASIAVNMSGLSMQNRAFCDRVTELLTRQVKPGAILIELTETADIEDASAAAASIAQLRGAGIPVCLDDFGAGSAAFRYLRDFRVDYVKLDGTYVRGALRNAREHGFLLSMVELANFVGAKIIAEMIEHEEEADMMRGLGVEYGQGWLFGKPGALAGSLSVRGAVKDAAMAEALP